MAVDHAVIEEIIYRNDIEEIIASYHVKLKRSGSNLVGLCPFHSEKSPSFTVFPSDKSFYCFGCGAGGNVISFIMKAENIDFPAALEMLARRAGIELPRRGEHDDGVKRGRILAMNVEAARYFHAQLKNAPAALAYLTEKRRLNGTVIKHFGLGYAPDSFDGLTRYLGEKGYTEEEMVAGFLCGRSRNNGRLYDKFRNRVMFPIIDVSGNVVAFGGRVMDDSVPKYLNSSDTPAFKKGRQLFALNYAKNHCGDGLILCEGYMDVIALHAAGFQNAVATLGTAIGAEQARIMGHYSNRVIICYDSDNAGQTATTKAFRLLGDAGLDARVIRMEGAKDPDEYIKKYGAERFRRLLDESVSRFDFAFGRITAKYNLALTEEKVKAAEETVDLILTFNTAVERELYSGKAASALGIPVDSLKHDIERKRRIAGKKQQSEEMRQVMLKAEGVGDRVNPDRMKNVKANAAEEVILGILLLYPENIKLFLSGTIDLTPDDFITAFNRRVFAELLAASAADGDLNALAEKFTSEEFDSITRMKVARLPLSNNGPQVLRECADTLKKSKPNSELEDIINGKRNSKDRAGDS